LPQEGFGSKSKVLIDTFASKEKYQTGKSMQFRERRRNRMAINYADQFAPKVMECFKLRSLTDSARGTAFSFTGVRSIKVMSVDTVPLNDYTRSGTNRYGMPVELGDSVQELTMRDDKAFAMTIDKGNRADQLNVKEAARAMRRETEQVVVPYVDEYRLREWTHHAGLIVPLSAAPTKNTIVDAVFDGGSAMNNRKVPRNGRTLFIKESCLKLLKLSDQFIGANDLAVQNLSTGEMGRIDGMCVKAVPDSYFPEGVYFFIKHKSATVDPVKLNETNIHQDPPGISGSLLEGRFYHDAFVLGAKADGIYVAVASGKQTAAPSFAENGGNISLSSAGAAVYYTIDGSDPRYSASAQVYSAAFAAPAGKMVRAYAVKDGSFPSGVSEKQY